MLYVPSLELVKLTIMSRFVPDVGPGARLLGLQLVKDTCFLQIVNERIESFGVSIRVNRYSNP